MQRAELAGNRQAPQQDNYLVPDLEQASLGSAALRSLRPLHAGTFEVRMGDKTEKVGFEVSQPTPQGAHDINLTTESGETIQARWNPFATVAEACRHVCAMARKPAAMAAGLMLSLSAASATSRGAIVSTLDLDSDHVALGATNSRTVWIKLDAGGGPTIVGSGVLLDSNHVYTAAHVAGGTGTYTVGNDANYAGKTGTMVFKVTIDPLYTGTLNGSPDDAIMTLLNPITNIGPIDYGTVTAGNRITGYGYGRHGQPGDASFPLDGNKRGWSTDVSTSPSIFGPNYYLTEFNNLAGTGNAFLGDSGGPYFDASGRLLGLSIAGDTSVSGNMLTTVLTPQTDFIGATVPEPPAVFIFGIAGAAFLLKRRRGEHGEGIATCKVSNDSSASNAFEVSKTPTCTISLNPSSHPNQSHSYPASAPIFIYNNVEYRNQITSPDDAAPKKRAA